MTASIVSNVNPTVAAAPQAYTVDSVQSTDGAIIGYRKFGQGTAGIVLVQGTMGSAQDFLELATHLADQFTVYVPDRRGRGMSRDTVSPYHIQREVEDLEALLAKTGSHFVFGLSSGALISLQSALSLSAIHKLAIYEPPLFINNYPVALIQRFEQEFAADNLPAAMTTAMLAAKMGPPIFEHIPRWLLERLTGMMLAQEAKKGSGDYLSMRELARTTLPIDIQVIQAMHGTLERLGTINTDVLLMGGSTSPTYLKTALGALEKVLPHTRRIEFAGLSHGSPWNSDKRGNSKPIADALKTYFSEA
jgi:pimeloyl-ACP methyl ester carboxylesterase